MVINVDGIKKLLSQKEGAEIRMGLKHAEVIGMDFSDKSIVELFENGIAVDIVIKNVDSEDFLPKRLEKYINMGDSDQIDRDNMFVKVKIVDLLKGDTLNPLEISGLLLATLLNDFKVAGYMNGDSDGFTRIRVINVKKDRFLNLKEIKDLLGLIIPKDKYEFVVEEI